MKKRGSIVDKLVGAVPKVPPKAQQLFKCICGEFDRLINQCKVCDCCSRCCPCKVKAVPVLEPEDIERVGEQDED